MWVGTEFMVDMQQNKKAEASSLLRTLVCVFVYVNTLLTDLA